MDNCAAHRGIFLNEHCLQKYSYDLLPEFNYLETQQVTKLG